METKPPSQHELIESAKISQAYASMILTGKRDPSPSLAIHIYRSTGWKHSILASLSDEDIASMERFHPWVRAA